MMISEDYLSQQKANHRTDTYQSNFILPLLIFIVLGTLWLAFLVIERRPFPISSLSKAGILTVTFAIICIIITKIILRLTIFSFPMLFLYGTFLYTLSSFIMLPLDGWYAFNNFINIDQKGLEQGLPIVLLAFFSFVIGSFIYKLSRHNLTDDIKKTINNTGTLRFVAFVIYFLSIFMMVFTSITGGGLSLSYYGGYSDFTFNNSRGLMSIIMNVSYSWFLPWACIILLATSQSKYQDLITILFVLLGGLLILLTGIRTYPTIILVLMIPIREIKRRPFPLWQIGLALLIVVVIISAWDGIRSTPIRGWSSSFLINTIASQTFGSPSNISYSGQADYRTPLGWLLANVSNSYQTLMGSIRIVPEIEPFRLGTDYLYPLTNIIPFLGLRDILENPPSVWITNRMGSFYSGLGFLQLGEAYINFGAFGVIVLYAFWGWFLPRQWWHLISNYQDTQLLSYAALFILGLLTWIRNDSGNMGRILVWGGIIVYLVPWVFRVLKKSRR